MRNELARTERWAALAHRLPAVLDGSDRPRDASEAIDFAYLAHARLSFAGAARLFAAAFRLQPRLADDLSSAHRYNAACSAAIAAAGRSRDEPLPAAGRSEERRAALEWLRADIAARAAVVSNGQPAEKTQLLQVLEHYRVDSDLAAVRSPRAVAELPAPEREDWRALWAEVDSLIKSLKSDPGAASASPSR
jgi:hypothetical protein